MSSLSLKTNILEKSLDYFPHVKHAVLSSIFFPLRIAQRACRVATGAVQLFRPDAYFKLTHPDARIITANAIENGRLDSLASRENLGHFVEKVEEVSQKLKLRQKLVAYAGLSNDSNSSEGSHRFSLRPIPIFMNASTLKASHAVIDYIVAHEASHSAHNDKAKQYLLSCAVLLVEIGAYYSGYGYALPLIEGAASFIANALQRGYEMAADTRAMEILGTNAGILEQLKLHAKNYLQYRIKDADTYFNTKSRWTNCIRKIYFMFSKKVFVSDVSPEGNYRKDIYHPPLSQRIANALSFKPKN